MSSILLASQNIFNFVGERGDEAGEKRTRGKRVLELLRKFSPRGLEYQEIDFYRDVGKSFYTVLDRLEDRQLIPKKPSRWRSPSFRRSVPEAISPIPAQP